MTHDYSVEAPDYIKADFAMICKGDSMINARIFDGDVVYIRQQDTVDDGQIAVVLVDNEAIMGRVWRHADGFLLQPENPAYASRFFYDGEDNAQVIGKVVAFTSRIPEPEVVA